MNNNQPQGNGACSIEKKSCCKSRSFQAFRLLQIAFFILPLLAGLDKFFLVSGNWDAYLSSTFNLLGQVRTTMIVVGVIEIVAAFGILWRPAIFAYIVALWLLLIIINLLMLHAFYDIALRDFALLLSALALARLSHKFGTCGSCGTCKK